MDKTTGKTRYEDLILSLYDNGAVKFGEFTLVSGEKSKIYIDLRILVSYPKLMRQVTDELYEKGKTMTFDRVAGVPYAALPIVAVLSVHAGWPMIYNRKEKKDYGTKKNIEGIFNPNETVLVVDDLVTTGLSKINSIKVFEEAGLKVKDILVLIDRSLGRAGLSLKEAGYNLHSIFKIEEMLDVLKAKGRVDPSFTL